MKFPPIYKFKHYVNKKKQGTLINIEQMMKTSNCKINFMNKLKNITLRDIRCIERRTRGQATNENWFFYRKRIITATLTYRISNAVFRGEESQRINAAISKIQSVQLHYPAIKYGRENEKHGIDAFMKLYRKRHFDVKVRQPGLRLDASCVIIGGSADAIISCSCCEDIVLEVKCPYSLRNQSAIKDGKNLSYIDDNFNLKRNTSYYYQIQTYLGIYGHKNAYLGVWTPKDILVIYVEFDKQFWVNLKSDLCLYYFNSYLKHYLN